jgi:hypothetical protein
LKKYVAVAGWLLSSTDSVCAFWIQLWVVAASTGAAWITRDVTPAAAAAAIAALGSILAAAAIARNQILAAAATAVLGSILAAAAIARNQILAAAATAVLGSILAAVAAGRAPVRHGLVIILFGFISLLPFETGRSSGRALARDPVRPSRLP